MYSRLFNQYAKRDMSDPGDVVFAFQGILSIMKRVLGTDSLAGIPEGYLHEGLLWLSLEPKSRREVKAGHSTAIPYPGWSWAGWKNRSMYVFDLTTDILPEVDWFVADDTGVLVRLHTPGTYYRSREASLSRENKDTGPGEPSLKFQESIRPRNQLTISDGFWNFSQHLATWTTVASFSITGECINLGHRFSTTHDHENIFISNDAGERVGSIIRIKVCWDDEPSSMGPGFEFMLLSRSRDPRTAYNNAGLGTYFFDTTVLPEREWCYLNVMLIQRTGEMASRVGIGIIHEDAWVKANLTPMLVKLE